MEVNDVVGEIVQDLKIKIRTSKKFLISYEVVALLLGLIVGFAAHQSSLSRSNPGSTYVTPLISNLLMSIAGLTLGVPLLIIIVAVIGIVFWFPATIAKKRKHAYVGLIQVLNLAGLFTGVTWFIALAWAIFPSEKSIIDPIVGNVTGLGRRNAGDTIGSAKLGTERGVKFEADTDSQIDKLIDMHTKGLISDEEFARKKLEIIQRKY